MSNINDAFPSKYLKCSDLRGARPVVTIARFVIEKVAKSRDGKEQKPVIYFVGKEKGLMLNKTNAMKITEIIGSAITEEWIGHAIRLYPSVTTFAGEKVECIRVQAVGTQRMTMTKPPPPPPMPLSPESFLDVSENDEKIPF